MLLFGRHDANQASSGWGISVCDVIVWSSWCQSGIVRVRHFCLWCYCLVVMMPIRHRQGEAFHCDVIVWSSWCQSGIVRVRHFCLWCYCLVVMMPIRHRQGEAFLFVVLLFGRHDANQASSGWGISVCGCLNLSVTCGNVVPRQVMCSSLLLHSNTSIAIKRKPCAYFLQYTVFHVKFDQ